jgi:hypothetical protein
MSPLVFTRADYAFCSAVQVHKHNGILPRIVVVVKPLMLGGAHKDSNLGSAD